MKDRKLTIFRRRNIGFIFQAFNLIPELTVEQNILFPVLLDYQKAGQGISGRTADRAESERPSEASAKSAFRWAAATGSHWPRPDDRLLILADDADRQSGHPEHQRGIALLKETSRKYEQTILMITHNRSIAQTADRVLQVSDGCLTDFGRCRE